MAIAILDTPTTSTTATYSLAPSAGSNRIAFVMINCGATGGAKTIDNPTAVSLGGQTMTNITSTGTGVGNMNGTVWALNDTQIQSMSGSALAFTPDADSAEESIIGFSISGANQTLTANDTHVEIMTYSAAEQTASASIDVVTDGISVLMTSCKTARTNDTSTPTHQTVAIPASSYTSINLGYGLTSSDTTETAVFDPNNVCTPTIVHFSWAAPTSSGLPSRHGANRGILRGAARGVG